MWVVWEDEDELLPVHVMPEVDVRRHSFDAECWCGAVEDDGVIVHNSGLGQEKWYEEFN